MNAEMMNQGVALQISEIRPDTNIEQEIFPRELTRDAQEKDIFTPPNHKQMRFLKSQGGKDKDTMPPAPSGNDQFFITENILEGDSRIIHEERSQQESELDNVPENDEFDQGEEMEDESEIEEMEMDANFDFGKAKMDYFKQRAKDILMNDNEIEYEGNGMQLGVCFKNLKNSIRNPIVVHGGNEKKPHYLKMTFSTCRAAVNGDRFLEMSKLIGKDGSLMPGVSNQSTTSVLALGAGSKIPALMRAGKDQYAGEEGSALLLMDGSLKKKTKKEEMIDKKIEYLLEAYKKQDEALMRKATNKSSKQR